MSATAENATATATATATTTTATPALPAVVEERVRGRVITDDPLYRAIPVALRFTPAEPLAVRVVFPADLSPEGSENEWVFPRALLEAGLQAPTGTGDVRVWPCGRVQAVVEFHSPEGVAVIQFDIKALRRFLRLTYGVTTR
ncbi:SsgA family sporulation/cell division regulator [Streptomyces goshikiensis]|uniref:SsgA family sporulation/cell division regulator n=1 Tax=Streptomyces goshikiensis TaxID=1942 RepID=A0ABZ1RNU6_9ACTN|nr:MULTISPECIES: SsgA family sporulation/cell division regulator [Streptomyces]EDX24813.1 cell division protein [Streptomyces sp. Mg1]MBP0934686.1 SsgA family sporulation/cell division regulator [Streptomyces sp. KCTC 0041BP]OKI35570.1 adenylate cyclase [Streptomyces sp. CB03578]PJN15673.1 SsgA family sporulation/cell division regulator [Streptomyces sp. CB02120-2]RPK50560.1 Sporulation and cell division protein [Streptomyces sp. ADI91-18]